MSNPDLLLDSFRRLPPAFIAFLAHFPALAVVTALLAGGWLEPGMPLALVTGIGAALTARLLKLPSWWTGINLLFVPLLWLLLQRHLNPIWFFAAFVLLALTSLGAVRSRVPLYLSSTRAAEELAKHLPAEGRVIDLGCGLGGPLAYLARTRPDARLSGIEAAPLNWLIARLRLAGHADIRLGSLWQSNLHEADLVYAYLSPVPMARLWAKARAEMKPGSLFISNSFAVPGVPPSSTVPLDDLSGAKLLLWRMP